ncbi:MAG: hypothetical protein K6G31_04075 [Paludibacteraceae bacterium]|nr:hypothetical protein [Paludibacteraceae bacterium]
MAKTNRRTLKEYFAAGKKPDSSQFADLIDSMLNIVDDGFTKTSEGGMTLSPTNGSKDGNVMEIRQDILDANSMWRFSLSKEGDFQIYKTDVETPVISLRQDGSVKVIPFDNTSLEIEGCVEAKAYKGKENTVPANAVWQDITPYLYDCMAYRVVAKVRGKKGTGHYAMIEVSTMNCFGRHTRIKKICQSWYGSLFNKIQFRWNRKTSEEGGSMYGLQVRTRTDYGEGYTISYYLLDL